MRIEEQEKVRMWIIQGIVVLGAAILIFKLAEIQLIDDTYMARANTNVIQKVTLYPSRGMMYDRNGLLIVNNKALYDLYVTYNQVREMDTLKFCEILDISIEEFERRLNKDWSDRRFAPWQPFIFMDKISSEMYARFQESMYEFPGFFVQLRNVRNYPIPAGAHVLGYLSEVGPEQIERYQGIYARGDYIGASGLEIQYEELLRGEKGQRYVLRDNLGRVQGSYKNGEADVPSISGSDLLLTLDMELQYYAEYLMQNKRGSIVAIEPSTGEVLALVSAPSYNPNLLSINRERPFAFNYLIQDSTRPFFNRALMAEYPPGSVFKSLLAAIALQDDKIKPHTGYTCRGAFYHNGRRLTGCRSHPHTGDVQTAIQFSCNNYFCQSFKNIIEREGFYSAHKGLDFLNEYLYASGMGVKLGIDFPVEGSGNVPTTAYYDRLYPRNRGSWYSTTIISLGIGQGEYLMTTLQMANMAALIGNEGYYITPHLLKAVREEDQWVNRMQWARNESGIESKHFIPVIEGMELVVQAGTARIASLAHKGITSAGKTGTSQNPHGDSHSVYVGFSPSRNPDIAIAVFVENSGGGSRYAAPIASLLTEFYITREIDESRSWIEDRMVQANLLAMTAR